MTDPQRIDRFLDAAGWGQARRMPLASDASARRYIRLRAADGAGAMLMDAPEARGEDVRPFLALTTWLRGAGFSAPEILAADISAGLLLIEDLGDGLYARIAARDPRAEAPLYAAAIDLLAALRDCPPPATLPLPDGCFAVPPYDAATLRREAALVPDWYLEDPSDDLRAAFTALVDDACAPVAAARDTMVLRDYHAENLLWLPERAGHARVGLLDYQDALRGHAVYDLVSLLEDARRDTAPELQAAMTARYAAATGTDPAQLASEIARLGAQRNLKILGIFARLCRRDGKPGYLALLPRVWSHLMRDLSHPDLAALRALVLRHVPAPDDALRARIAAGAVPGGAADAPAGGAHA